MRKVVKEGGGSDRGRDGVTEGGREEGGGWGEGKEGVRDGRRKGWREGGRE